MVLCIHHVEGSIHVSLGAGSIRHVSSSSLCILRCLQADMLLAYQAGLDLVENELQSFLSDIEGRLGRLAEQAEAQAAAAGAVAGREEGASGGDGTHHILTADAGLDLTFT